jgi:hypothetical protein
MVPNEIFRAAELLNSKDVKLDEDELDGRPVYVLRWNERSGPPHWPKIEKTMWVDRETYAPRRYTDHSWGLDAQGKPFDETYVETVREFHTLPDTPSNRKQLELTTRP